MAQSRYITREYMPQENNQYEAWKTTHNGFDRNSDGWSKTGFANGSEDHIYKKSVITCTPENGCVVTTETIVEEHVPAKHVYGNRYAAMEGPLRGHGGADNGWNKHSPTHDRYSKSDEYLHGEIHTPHGSKNPSGNTIWEPHFHGTNGRNEPAEGGLARQGRAGWTTPPTEVPYMKLTNDVGRTSTHVTTATTHGQFVAPKEEIFPHTIDSRLAANKYGAYSVPPQAVREAATYSPTIDSIEAARRYKGQIV